MGARVPGIEQLNVGQLSVGSFNHSMPGTELQAPAMFREPGFSVEALTRVVY
jgi:hypothetical protein